ncbi:MAG: hypothetical protein OEV78_02255 [Spirochaetia bacterium]|nr:hypothetical protein [Spirochaetia bacterium]
MFKKLYHQIFLILVTFILTIFYVEPGFAQANTEPDVEFKADPSAKKPAEVKISGLLREDAYYIRMPEPDVVSDRKDLFANVLETRLILDRSREDWSFYADGRLYLYGGETQKAYGTTRLSLMRVMMRYFSPIGDFTIGKTYVNFGNSGLFNPFEIDKKIQMTDLQYAREGLYAAEYYLPWQDLSGVKIYTGFNDAFDYNPMLGISPSYHLGKFDIGGIYNHSDIDKNITGFYFKGDAILGIQGSWGAHLNDKLKYSYSEISGGIDYSFFEGKIVTTLLFYYNENGADEYKKYKVSPDSFLLAKYYGFLSVSWLIDEFWSVQLNAFMNLIDNSAVIMPVASFIITSGLSVTLQVNMVTAKKEAEFSRDKSGDFSALMRVEGRF